MSGGALSQGPGFSAEFEAAQARLCFAVESSHATGGTKPERIATALRAVLDFAASNPTTLDVLASRALAYGPDGIVRQQSLLATAALVMSGCRDELQEGMRLPAITERALIGGLATLVAHCLEEGRAEQLPALAPEAIEFVLTPYVGPERARHLAGEGGEHRLGPW